MTWQDDLHDNGIMMREVDVANALIAGVAEKTSMISSSPTISIAALDGCGFCSALDANITAIAPSFIDGNNNAYPSDLGELCSAAGYNTVVYGATPGSVILKNGGVQFSADYVAQRKDILALFTDCEAITLPSSLSIYVDTTVVAFPEPILVVVTPSDAYSEVNWTSSDPSVATVDESGYITVHKDGDTTITASCKKNNTIKTSVGIACYERTSENALTQLAKMKQDTYTQNGLTITQNSDGTFTIDGTSTAGDKSYQRFVLWPLGNNKNSYNLKLVCGDPNIIGHAWFKYISGTFNKSDSTLATGSYYKWFEIYFMNKTSEVWNKMQCFLTRDPENNAAKWRYGTRNLDGTPVTGVVLGIQVKNGTVFDNFTFEVGVGQYLKNNATVYDLGLLEDYIPAVYRPAYENIAQYNYNHFIMRQPNNVISMNFASRGFSGYTRLTSSYFYGAYSNAGRSSLLTGNTIGIIRS